MAGYSYKERITREVIMSMAPLFKAAKDGGKWFRSHYQGIIFTPEELEDAQAHGRYLWGAKNWELISPHDEKKRLASKVKNAKLELVMFEQRMINGGIL